MQKGRGLSRGIEKGSVQKGEGGIGGQRKGSRDEGKVVGKEGRKEGRENDPEIMPLAGQGQIVNHIVVGEERKRAERRL